MLPILTTMSAGQGVKSLTEALCAQFMTVFDVDCDGRLNLIEFTALNRFFFLVACLDEERGNREDVSVGTGQASKGAVDANSNAAVFSVQGGAEHNSDPSATSSSSSRTPIFPPSSEHDNPQDHPTTTTKKVPMSAEEAQMAIAAAAAHLAVEAPPASVLESLDAVLSTAYR